MAHFTGTEDDDSLVGTNNADKFNMAQDGTDTASGLGGKDVFKFGATFNALDTVDGGGGNDVLKLQGDYQIPTTLAATTLTSVETIKFANGFSYNFALDAANVAAGEFLTLDASKLDAGHAIGIDASAIDIGNVNVIGGAGNDVIYGDHNNGENATINMTRGGDDQVTIYANDQVYFGDTFTADDKVTAALHGTGGINLDGDYSAGLTFGETTAVGVGLVFCAAGHSYSLTLNDATAQGSFLVIGLGSHATDDVLFVDGTAETDTPLLMESGGGDDTLIGGNLSDTFYVFSGEDTVTAGIGDDVIHCSELGNFDGGDKFSGGVGSDTLEIVVNGDLDANLAADTMQGIEILRVAIVEGHPHITLDDANVAAGETLTVNVLANAPSEGLILDAYAESNGTVVFNGNYGNDAFLGGGFGNVMNGGDGADSFTAGQGVDTVTLSAVSNSQGQNFDRVNDFDWSLDVFDVVGLPTAIAHKLVQGTVNDAHFAQNLENAVGTHLGASEAMLFEAANGDEAGRTFLLIDQNGVEGYQSAGDLVVRLANASHHIDVGHFI